MSVFGGDDNACSRYRSKAPIDVYWVLMEQDKNDEALRVLETHPNDPACVLESALRVDSKDARIGNLKRAVELGNPVAMAFLGWVEDDEETLERARRSGSEYARALAMDWINGFPNSVQELSELYQRAAEKPETPRVYVSYIEWLKSLPEQLPMMAAVIESLKAPVLFFAEAAAVRGVPAGILYYVEELFKMDETHPRNDEILRQLQRPAIRGFPRTTEFLALLYETSYFMLDLGKAASLTLSLPRSHEHLIVQGLVTCLQRKWSDRLDHVCRERLMYGRALALRTTRLPKIPRNMCAESEYGMGLLQYLHDLDVKGFCNSDCPSLVIRLLYHEARSMPGKRIDSLLIAMVDAYWTWIEAVRDAICEFILVCSVLRPRLPRDVVVGVIARIVWNDRERDAPTWCHLKADEESIGNKRMRLV